jgi:hypothetical protein
MCMGGKTIPYCNPHGKKVGGSVPPRLTIHNQNPNKMEANVIIPTAPAQSAVKMSDTKLGTFGALTANAASYQFDPTNFANKETAILLFAVDANGKEDKFILSKPLSQEWYRGEIGLDQVLTLDVRLASNEEGEEIKIITRPTQRMTIDATKITAKPYVSKSTLSEAEMFKLANISI